MAVSDISIPGFIILFLSLLLVVYPEEGIFFRLVFLFLALAGWTVIEIANEIENLRSEIWELHHEIKFMKRQVKTNKNQ